jgi:ankyrin repeat protein
MELLLNLGLDPNASDKHGWTPLHHAAACGHTRVAALLLRVGADRSTRATAGQTPADLAHLNGHPWTIG